MKVCLESTERVVEIERDGVKIPARVWEGFTEKGVKCFAVIPRIACHTGEDEEQFKRELQECAPPTEAAIRAIPLRFFVP